MQLTRNVKAVLLETEPTKYYKGSICHEENKGNIGTINEDPNFWSNGHVQIKTLS